MNLLSYAQSRVCYVTLVISMQETKRIRSLVEHGRLCLGVSKPVQRRKNSESSELITDGGHG